MLRLVELNDIIDTEWPEAAQLVVPQQIYAAIKELQDRPFSVLCFVIERFHRLNTFSV